MKIISFLLNHPDEALNKTTIIEGAGVGRTTFYKKLGSLVDEHVLVPIGSGRTTLYQLNDNNPLIKALLRLRKEDLL